MVVVMGLSKLMSDVIRGGAAAASLGLVFGVFSCSFTVDFDQVQCKKTSDCTKLGGEFKHGTCGKGGVCLVGPECLKSEECSKSEGCVEGECVDRWLCLDDDAPLATNEVSFSLPVTTIFGMPLPGTPVKLCESVDTGCLNPAANLQADESGMLSFQVEESFTGYLETAVPGFFPQINFLPDVLTDPPFLPPITLSPTEIIEGLAQQVGAAADPDRGHVVVSVASCFGVAPNLVISAGRADESTIPYYVNGGVPAPDRQFTTDEGSGGFLNIVVGTGELKIAVQDGDELFSRNIFVRKGTISTVHFQPPALALAQAQAE
jgi:hypothetical protein